MIGALLYLQLTSRWNSAIGRLRRLRQPKYLAGAGVAAAYLWFFIFRPLLSPHGAAGFRGAPGAETLPLFFIFLPYGVIAVVRIALAWLAPASKPGLVFTEAEIAFLFPAPFTRRMLLHYKLLSSQLTILLSSVLLALLMTRWRSIGGNFATHALGWWTMQSTLSLHATGAGFTVARLIEGGVSRVRRQAAVIAAIIVLLGAVGYAAWRAAAPPPQANPENFPALARYASEVAGTGPLGWLLWPIRIMLKPLFAPGWAAFLRSFGPALLLLAAHYVWVLRAETSFEEASIALAERRARQLATLRSGRIPGAAATKGRRPPFPLASSGGRPELAFLWKNLLSTSRVFNVRILLIAVVFAVWLVSLAGHPRGAVRSVPHGELWVLVAAGAAMAAAYTLLAGPQFARQDLRSDLPNVDLLKAYPLQGWQVMLGELLAPAAILTGILWLALLADTVALSALPPGFIGLSLPLRLAAAAGLALIAPPLCLLQLIIPNGAALLFPSWAQTARTRERGLDLMGQRLIFVFGQLLGIVIALVPAVVWGTLLWFAARWVCSEAASAVIATAGVLAVLGGEVCLGIWWLGRRFDRFDLSSESPK